MAEHIGAYVRALRKLLLASAICLAGMGKAPAQIPASDYPGKFPWNPGMMSKGGIPNATNICATLSPSGGDDTNAINNAINACSSGVVMLNAGTFKVGTPAGNYIQLNSNVVLRGAGTGQTILTKTNGAHGRLASYVSGTHYHTPVDPSTYSYDPTPIVIVGPSRYPGPDNSTVQNLTVDGAAGSYSITVANGSFYKAGMFILLDETSNANWQATPPYFGCSDNLTQTPCPPQVWKGDRFAWNMHWAEQQWQDDNGASNSSCPYDPPFTNCKASMPAAMGWFSRPDRATNETKEIASVSSNTITFTSSLSESYRVSHGAQIIGFTVAGSPSTANSIYVTNAGVENLTMTGGGDGSLRFENAAYSWAENVEVTQWLNEGIAIDESFRIEVRGTNIHTGAWPMPGGAGYAISLADGSAEALIEDNSVDDTCKDIVFRSSGTGSVVAYNYMDDAWDADSPQWQEVHLNASHMAGPHHVLFEGNWAPNFDSDYTHGSSTLITVFRNYLSGYRLNGEDTVGVTGNMRAAGDAYGGWNMSFIGNVLGTAGKMAGWNYTDPAMACDANGNNCAGNTDNAWGGPDIWEMGYDPERWSMAPDPMVLSTMIRDGNYDFLTNSQRWHNTQGGFTLPNSLYLTSPPQEFVAAGYAWPPFDPSNGTIGNLPAQVRFVNGSGGGSPPPTATLTANPTRIASGASSALTWTSTNARICSGTNFTTGNSATSGSVSVSPTTTTQYTVTCKGAGGSASANATVTVTSGSMVNAGETTVLPNTFTNKAGTALLQNITLPQTGTLQSVSIYLIGDTAAKARARLGVFKPGANGCTTGATKVAVAKSNPVPLVAGWNTFPVNVPTKLTAGAYCLSWTINDSSAQLASGPSTYGGGEVSSSEPFSAIIPSTWPAVNASGGNHISYYAIFSVP